MSLLLRTVFPTRAVTIAKAVSTCERFRHRMPEPTCRICRSLGVMEHATAAPLPACMISKGASRLANIPIHNETEYTLTDEMVAHIIRDAQEHFGEEVRAVRVQSGLERHAFNARTHEVRYAFSPQDFGFGPTLPITPEPLTPETPRSRRRFSRSDAAPEADLLPAALENVEEDAEDTEDAEPLEMPLESLDEGHDADEEEDVFTLDNPNDDQEDEEDQE